MSPTRSAGLPLWSSGPENPARYHRDAWWPWLRSICIASHTLSFASVPEARARSIVQATPAH
eukprot:158339-Pyramimonas_sp.AAC.1